MIHACSERSLMSRQQSLLQSYHHPLPLILLLLLLLARPSASEPTNQKYLDCLHPTSYSCGNHNYNIAFPFGSLTRPDYCSYPDYHLACIGSVLLFYDYKDVDGAQNTSNFYQVKGIDYTEQALNLTYRNLVDQSCPPTLTKGFINSTLFNYTDSDVNLTVYINCNSSFSSAWIRSIDCKNGDHWYYSWEEQLTSLDCASIVSIPFFETIVNSLVNGQIEWGDAVQEGFSVKWTVGQDWSGDCLRSGGVCGYDSVMPDTQTCFCPNNTTHNGTCKSGVRFSGKSKGKTIAIVVTAGTSSIFLVFLLICLYLYRAKKSHNQIIVWKSSKRPPSIESFLEKNGSLTPKRYQYSDVKKMTKSFSDKLGQGGYGVVYKGKLHDGRYVAVKVLSSSKGNGEEFVNEVASIGRTSHVNVVSLVGFCYEGSKTALIYDFMPNGSLEKFIYSERSETIPLGWERLFNIAVGIARGLEYLHRGCNTRIVHFDIKPHNILLDQDFCPKISDFGLSKLCRPKESFISMCGARGTPGYIAPEILFRNFGAISGKSDFYSYGMMVLEMVGGRKNVNIRAEKTSEIYFPHWIYEHQDQDGDLQVCGVTNETVGIARKMIIVGLWCIQTMPQSRPSISRVLEMLEGSIDGLQLPPKPSLSSPPRASGAPSTGST